MTQVVGLIEAHDGKGGVELLIAQLVSAEPFVAKVGVTDMPTPNVPFLPAAPSKLNVGTLATTESVTVASCEDPAPLVATIV
jgi:hypothetical protein